MRKLNWQTTLAFLYLVFGLFIVVGDVYIWTKYNAWQNVQLLEGAVFIVGLVLLWFAYEEFFNND